MDSGNTTNIKIVAEDRWARESLIYVLFKIKVSMFTIQERVECEVFKKDHQTRHHKTRNEWKISGKCSEKSAFHHICPTHCLVNNIKSSTILCK